MTDKKWYIVQTYSGYENKARLAIEERISRLGFADQFE
jgi:transcription antitermination factor NusG